jgi:hypothetical protein
MGVNQMQSTARPRQGKRHRVTDAALPTSTAKTKMSLLLQLPPRQYGLCSPLVVGGHYCSAIAKCRCSVLEGLQNLRTQAADIGRCLVKAVYHIHERTQNVSHLRFSSWLLIIPRHIHLN